MKEYGKNILNFVLLVTVGLPVYLYVACGDFIDYLKTLY